MLRPASNFFRCFGLLAATVLALVSSAPAQVLTKAIEVRSLTPAQAQLGLKAHLRGTVVFIEVSAVFVQDETSTTFFRPEPPGTVRPGDEIEVEGLTRMGLFLPGIGAATPRVLRHGKLPAGIPATYDDLVSARFHYQRVAVEGVVRSVVPLDEGRSLLRLTMGASIVEVRIDVPPERDRPLVDARVRLVGLAAGYHNERRQLVQAHLRVIDWSDVTVLDVAPPAAEAPLVSAEELLAFRLTGRGDRRVRIAGVVTAAFPPDRVYLRQGGAAFGVRLDAPPGLAPGDRIELAGFPEMDRFSASVVDGELLSRVPGPPPPPVEVGSPDLLLGSHDGQLVSVVGVLADAFKTDGGTVLVLQSPKRTIQVRVPESVVAPEAGSKLRLTGICLVETTRPGAGFASRAGIVSLRARGTGDIVVLQSPPWWTERRLALFLAALAAVTFLAALWIAILRLQVSRQTTALRRRIESEAALEERQRIAREFHDTLEQELAGVSLRLDALATRELDEKGRQLTVTSRHLVSRIQAETRNLISDLRDPCESAGDLVSALVGVATRHSADSGIEVRAEIAGAVPPVAAGTVHDLRMIARESVTNALKHAAPSSVVIGLSSAGGRLTMRITDDGRGFDPAARTPSKRGHFGCAGIRERCRKLGADVAWQTAPGQGTTVEVTLRLTSALGGANGTVPAAN